MSARDLPYYLLTAEEEGRLRVMWIIEDREITGTEIQAVWNEIEADDFHPYWNWLIGRVGIDARSAAVN
jgi:hypothetical protein